MHFFTVDFDTGGNHGHKIKDYLGGLTIGKLFNLEYIHKPFSYLDYFGVGYNSKLLLDSEYQQFDKIITISGPLWHGISEYNAAIVYFNSFINTGNLKTLFVFRKALRIHPFQTIPWFNQGLISTSIFNTIISEVSENFCKLHSLSNDNKYNIMEVAIHINRGIDFDKEKYPKHFSNPFAVRYMFPMSYYNNIIEQLEDYYHKNNLHFTIYTEKYNSEEIVAFFSNRKNIDIFLGPNRSERRFEIIHYIFLQFVKSDILVNSNSSFSSVCAYFRKNKKTIYHPHEHLDHLPEPNFIKTDDHGFFNSNLLA